MSGKLSKLTKGRSLIALLTLTVALTALAGFDWVVVSISPNGMQTELGTLSGGALFASVQAVSVLALVGVLVAAISHGIAQRVTIAMIALAAAYAGVVAAVGMLTGDLSGQGSQLEIWTSIASAHDIDKLTITTTGNGWLFVAFAAATAFSATQALFASRNWVTRLKKYESPTGKSTSATDEPLDAIGLWESQRKAD